MDTFAMWIGYATMVSGGLALATMLITVACDALWQRLKDAHSLARIMRAVKRDVRTREARDGGEAGT